MWLAEVGEKRLDEIGDPELILNVLAETATKDIANASNPEGFEENKKVAKRGGM